jgi:DNA-binding NarL/FixJ family response regulator
VLILTTFDHDEYVYSALRAGASGFLLKERLMGLEPTTSAWQAVAKAQISGVYPQSGRQRYPWITGDYRGFG